MESDFVSPKKNQSLQKQATKEEEKSDRQKQFLQFHLAPDTKVMLPIDRLTEVMTIPLGQIVPIPHMNPEVMGVYNWRGEILWMVDLGKIVGLLPWYEQTANKANYKAIVINIEQQDPKNIAKTIEIKLGLVVSRVEDIKWCAEKSIYKTFKSSRAIKLADFLEGCWLNSDNKEEIPILSGQTLLNYLPARAVEIDRGNI
ncbi:MAG: chemotaxis protein CheW [Prochloraceae cyanobacterium]